MGILACLVYVHRPPRPLWPSLFFVYFFAFIWTAGEIYTSFHALEPASYHIGLMIYYAGLLMAIPTWWVFSFAFASHLGHPFTHRSPLIRYTPYGIAAVFWIILATNPLHGKYLVPIIGDRNEYRVIWYVSTAVNYLLLLAVIANFAHLRWRTGRSAFGSQVTILLAATLLPVIGNVIYIGRLVDINFDPTVSMFAISGILFFIGIYRNRLFALSPIALQHVIQNERDGILILDSRFRLLHSNPAAKRFFDQDELSPFSNVLQILIKRVHPENAPEKAILQDEILRILENDRRKGSNTVFRYDTNDCNHVQIELTEVPNLRGDVGVQVIRLRDVTAQATAENALRDIAHGFSTVSSANYFTELVQYLSNTLGVRYVLVGGVEQETGDTVQTIAVCENGEIVENMSYNMEGTPCHNVYKNELCYYPADVQDQFPKDDLLKEMGVNAYAGIPLLSSKGTPIGILSVLHDTPFENQSIIESTLQVFATRSAAELERLLIGKELEASRRLLDEAQEIADLGAWRWDVRTNKIEWSDTMYTIFGQNADHFRPDGKSSLDLVLPTDRKRAEEIFWDAIRNRDGYEMEVEIVRPDGNTRIVHIRAQFQRDAQGNNAFVVGTTQDITERKLLERHNLNLERQLLQSQKMESIGTLAGGIAHDFNNILQAIMGYNALALERVGDDATMCKYLTLVEEGSLRASDLVRQILTFSGQDTFELKEIDLAVVVGDAIEFLRHAIPASIRLECDITSEPCPALAGPVQIHQLVTNLCTNSMHALEERQGIVSVSLHRREIADSRSAEDRSLRPGQYAELIVRDTGSGIPKEDLNRLFDPFFTTKEVGKGTGLGLAVVHGIVRRLEGDIIVESEPGSGTAITVLIPVTKHHADVSLQEDINTEFTPTLEGGNGHRRILIVDDEVAITQLLKTVLEDRGHTVEVFNDPEEAYDHVAAGRLHDLALLDYTMPKLNGFELALRFERLCPTLDVIIATGNLDLAPLEKAKPANVKTILRKPFRMKDIIEAAEF